MLELYSSNGRVFVINVFRTISKRPKGNPSEKYANSLKKFSDNIVLMCNLKDKFESVAYKYQDLYQYNTMIQRCYIGLLIIPACCKDLF